MSDRAEFHVEDAISKFMFNKPGLLRRGLNCEKRTYAHLKDILGEITPNCFETNCSQHKAECFQMESDIIFLYPTSKIIHIIIIEVKRPQGIGLNNNLVTGAFIQLVKDVKFILSLLPDVPKAGFKIHTFAAFPETLKEENFCMDCSNYILSKEDFNQGSDHLIERLRVTEPNLNDNNKDLFLLACARLIGKEADDISPKELSNYIACYETMVDSIIFLDNDQASILSTIDRNSKIKHFAFKGPSGSGKTIMGIKCVNKLAQQYLSQGVKYVFVYAIAYSPRRYIVEKPQN